MPRALPVVSAQEAVAALERSGFTFVSQRGSHRKYRNPQSGRRCVVPMHRTLATGTLASILRQAGLSVEDFVNHLR
jgi:predicted RNA binding protein YcfA (HicA-like mRNA interferase family)